MNKEKFIQQLLKRTNYTKNECEKINSILEQNFLMGKKNKEKILMSLIETLKINEEEADNIYNTSADILLEEIKERIRHPFKSQD